MTEHPDPDFEPHTSVPSDASHDDGPADPRENRTNDDRTSEPQRRKEPGHTTESLDPDWLEARILQHIKRPNYHPVKPRVIAKQLGLSPDSRSDVRKAIRRLSKQGKLRFGAKHLVRPLAPPRPASNLDSPTADSKSRDSKSRDLMPPPRSKSSQHATSPDSPESPAEVEFDSRKWWEASPDSDASLGEGEFEERNEPDQDLDEELELPREARRTKKGGAEVIGTFRRASGGYGFVRPQNATREEGRSRDIYVSAKRSLDAASGDLVLVRLSNRRGKRGGKSDSDEPRVHGTILEVLRREDHRFVGNYFERGGSSLVQIDGRLFQQPIPVGDPGAKNVRPGDQVVIEMVRFPTHYDPGEGVVIEVLGPRGAPGVDTLAIMREYDLPDAFPEPVLENARQQAAQFDESIAPDRRDLTEVTVITIDPVDARDFDDAISLDQLENGHWLLGVHIADVAHFVPLGSPLDREARRRATSVYLPDRVIPMLPEIISNHLASLQPDRIRYARSVFIEMTPEGIPVNTEFTRSAIRSKRRFSYEEVDDFLEDPPAWNDRLAPDVSALLLRMRDLAMVLRQRRLDAGSIELILPEVKIVLDDDGRVAGARLVQNTVSHQVIEEFMLAANRSVAELLHARQLLFLRRIHDAPALRKLRLLTEFIRELGLPCESMESRFEIKRIIAAVKGEPTEHAVNYAILRSFQKAVYGPEPSGHYALHWEHYCHFTSPIRRYPDLDVHRMLDALQSGKRPRSNRGELSTLGDHCSDREQRAEAAERELVKLKLLDYLKDHIGMEMPAVLTGVEEFGLFAQGVDLPAEGFIAVSSLQDDFYRFDAAIHALTGHRSGNQYRLGDRVTVEVVHVDLARRELDLRIIKHEPSPRHGRPLGKRDKGAGKPKAKLRGSKRNLPKRRRK